MLVPGVPLCTGSTPISISGVLERRVPVGTKDTTAVPSRPPHLYLPQQRLCCPVLVPSWLQPVTGICVHCHRNVPATAKTLRSNTETQSKGLFFFFMTTKIDHWNRRMPRLMMVLHWCIHGNNSTVPLGVHSLIHFHVLTLVIVTPHAANTSPRQHSHTLGSFS